MDFFAWSVLDSKKLEGDYLLHPYSNPDEAKMESREKENLLLPQKLRYFKGTGRRAWEILRDVEKRKERTERTC